MGSSPVLALLRVYILPECLRADDREPSMLDDHMRGGAVISCLGAVYYSLDLVVDRLLLSGSRMLKRCGGKFRLRHRLCLSLSLSLFFYL